MTYSELNRKATKDKIAFSRTSEYHIWRTMRDRCNNPNNQSYEIYGGRGVTICQRWQDSFHHFLEDMGKRPSSKHSVDRKDTNGNYEPGNCKWATWEEQQNNRRDNIRITYQGETLTVAQWARKYRINAATLYYRIHHMGLDFSRVIGSSKRLLRLDDNQAGEVRELYACGDHTMIEIAAKYKVSRRMIGDIIHRRNYWA